MKWVLPCYLLGKHILVFVGVDLRVTDILSAKIVIYLCASCFSKSYKNRFYLFFIFFINFNSMWTFLFHSDSGVSPVIAGGH
jgi:hypothetical protein